MLNGDIMTVKEYNKEFLPKITTAKHVLTFMEQEFQKVKYISEDAYEQCMTELKCLGWNEEIKDVILNALEYYRIHEGIEKI